ncbi:MAG TPA: YigZ family protein [Thermoanaerobaculia bacterium]|nr:YigZ family protein [Thermoanaerobaculia bacterium]
MRVAALPAEGEIREKGSRFLAVLRPVAGEEEAKSALAELARRFPDATHRCWAWRLGQPPRERRSDAGEPAGTAGVPILRALRGAELWGVLAVVVRWFGGVKLGKGGLARAYTAATQEALVRLAALGGIAERTPAVTLTLEVPYERLGAVKRLLHPPEVELIEAEYGVRARLVLRVHAARKETLEESLAGLGVPKPPA